MLSDSVKLHKRLELIKNLFLEDYPNATFLHIGLRGCGKSLLLKYILHSRLASGYRCVYVCIKHPPHVFVWTMKKRNMDVEPYLKEGKLVLVDYYSPKIGRQKKMGADLAGLVKPLKSLDLTELSVLLESLRMEAIEALFIDGLSDIFVDHGSRDSMKFINLLTSRTRETCIGAFALDQEVLNPRLENYLRSISDSVLEYKVVEEPEGLARYVRVAHFDFAMVDTKWHKLEIGPYDLRIL